MNLFAPGKDQQVETVYVGNERQPLLKVDSLFQGVDLIRQHAININSFKIADSFYPGLRMETPVPYSIALVKSLGFYIQEFFKLDLQKIKKIASRYSIVTFAPEKLGLMQRIPHFDAPNPNSLAIVYYLCEAPDSGTALYRHRESQYEYIDEARYENYMANVHRQFSNPDEYPKGYICGDTPEYEQIASYSAQYNRMIAYHGSSLHSGIITPEYKFDPNPSSGRLTITTFIEFE
jgi:Family of unknown function (DUF6445)